MICARHMHLAPPYVGLLNYFIIALEIISLIHRQIYKYPWELQILSYCAGVLDYSRII